MSKVTETIYNKSKTYFIKKANNIYTKENKIQKGKLNFDLIWRAPEYGKMIFQIWIT